MRRDPLLIVADGAAPEVALACAIIERAVKDWRRAAPGTKGRKELITFFRGDWCQYLWESTMPMPLEVALDELGVPRPP